MDDHRAVTAQLHHDHLPRLAEHDVVDYDPSSNEIGRGPNFDALEPYVFDLEVPVESE